MCDNGASNGACPAACSASCTVNTCSSVVCGDGICSSSETFNTCPPDCSAKCGDGKCTQPIESCRNCTADCACTGGLSCGGIGLLPYTGVGCMIPNTYPVVTTCELSSTVCSSYGGTPYGTCSQTAMTTWVYSCGSSGGGGGSGPVCGDGQCTGSENCGTCAADCKCGAMQVCQGTTCVSTCGNGACNAGESYTTCPSDCTANPLSPTSANYGQSGPNCGKIWASGLWYKCLGVPPSTSTCQADTTWNDIECLAGYTCINSKVPTCSCNSQPYVCASCVESDGWGKCCPSGYVGSFSDMCCPVSFPTYDIVSGKCR